GAAAPSARGQAARFPRTRKRRGRVPSRSDVSSCLSRAIAALASQGSAHAARGKAPRRRRHAGVSGGGEWIVVARPARWARSMFTIEHDFDATVITRVDEGSPHLEEDVTIQAFEECVTIEQYDPRRDEVVKIVLSMAQVNELAAALNLP